jgi:hypothetical protein
MITDKEIKDIERVFPMTFEGRSRIDNNPFFRLKYNNSQPDYIRDCFDASIIDYESEKTSDNSQILVLKINDVKQIFY